MKTIGKTIRLNVLFVLLLSLLLAVGVATRGALAALPDRAFEAPAPPAHRESSPFFIENVGQFAEGARFQMRGAAGGTLWLADDALWIALSEQGSAGAGEREGTEGWNPSPYLPITPSPQLRKGVNLKLSFPAANPNPRLEPFERRDAVINYYRGNDPAGWHTRVPVWGGVRYVDLYPGVDLEITGENGRWAWQFTVHNSTIHNSQFTIDHVRLHIEGADDVALDGSALRLTTPLGDLALPLLTLRPGGPRAVEGQAGQAAEGGASTGQPKIVPLARGMFAVAAPFAAPPITRYSPSSATDYPNALILSTFLGGGDDDEVNALAVGDDGAIYSF